MKNEGSCMNCKAAFIKRRNPQQHYCSAGACQLMRKNAWRREKIESDADYKKNKQASNKRWQSQHPDYWINYRDTHPEYVQRNRLAQRVRDGTGDPQNASHLAKCDALPIEPLLKSGTYLLTLPESLAKCDALLVKITLITGGYKHASHLAKIPPYSQSVR